MTCHHLPVGYAVALVVTLAVETTVFWLWTFWWRGVHRIHSTWVGFSLGAYSRDNLEIMLPMAATMMLTQCTHACLDAVVVLASAGNARQREADRVQQREGDRVQQREADSVRQRQ